MICDVAMRRSREGDIEDENLHQGTGCTAEPLSAQLQVISACWLLRSLILTTTADVNCTDRRFCR